MAREDVEAEDCLCRLGEREEEEGDGEEGLWEHLVDFSIVAVGHGR